MKKLKVNLMMIAAFAIATITMSFSLSKSTLADGWYAVDTDEETIIGPTTAPTSTDNCRTNKLHDLCKIQVPESEVPESVSQAREDDLILEEAFRNN